MSVKEFKIANIGNVKVVKKRGLKNISISVKPFEGVRVSIPFSVSYSRALKFVDQKSNWIVKAIARMNSIENQNTVFLENSSFTTLKHQLYIQRNGFEEAKVRVANNKILVHLGENTNIKSPAIQQLIRLGIERAWSKEAKELLPQKVTYFADKYGFQYSSVSIKRTVSRWGSCSSKNQISLSLYLMQLPEYLMDYVIIHELVHTRVKNHQQAFWDHMEQLLGNARSLAKEMKRFKPGIY